MTDMTVNTAPKNIADEDLDQVMGAGDRLLSATLDSGDATAEKQTKFLEFTFTDLVFNDYG